MSKLGRLQELSRKHARFEEKISEEQKRPAPNSLRVQTLKRRKLVIKQAITAYESQDSLSA